MGFPPFTPDLQDQTQQQANNSQSSPQAPTATPGVTGATGAWDQPIYAQPPQPPSASASQLPPPQFVDQQRQGPLKNLLTRFMYGGGQAMLAHVGLPTDFELERTEFNQNLQQSQLSLEAQRQQMAEQQQQFNQQQVPIVLPNGTTVVAPQNQIGKILANSVTGAYGVQKQQVANQGKQAVAEIQFGPNIPLDPTVAKLAGVPQLAGTLVGRGLLDNISKMLAARGITQKDMGDGTYLVDRSGVIARIGGSPSVARAFAFGQARAMYTPFETIDDQGNAVTISNMQALKTGAPGIGKPNATQNLGKAALLGDIRGGINQVRQLTDVLDNAPSRARIAGLLASFGTAGQFVQSGVASSLTPREQDYVIAVLNLKENAMAMRSTLGAGQGSEDLRDAIQRTIPGASTPGSSYANRQLDLAARTLDRLAPGIISLGKATERALGGEGKGGTPNPPANSRFHEQFGGKTR